MVLLAAYSLVLQFVPAPDAAGAGPLTIEGNIVGYIDRSIMPAHLYLDGFDPEGFEHPPGHRNRPAGHVHRRLRPPRGAAHRAVRARPSGWPAPPCCSSSRRCSWNCWQPINKSLWNGSFVCAAGGYSLGMFALFYYLIDVRQWRRWTYFFKVIGVNSITIYLGQQIISFLHLEVFVGGLAAKLPPEAGAVVLSIGYIACCWLLLWFLDRQRIYLKV